MSEGLPCSKIQGSKLNYRHAKSGRVRARAETRGGRGVQKGLLQFFVDRLILLVVLYYSTP